MRKMKKVISVAMAAAMTMSLAACGNSANEPAAAQTDDAAETKETVAETTAAEAETTQAAEPEDGTV